MQLNLWFKDQKSILVYGNCDTCLKLCFDGHQKQ